MLRSALAATTVLIAAGCGGPTEPSGAPNLLERLPRPLSVAEQGLIDAGNAFTFDLFRQATADLAPDSNAFLSPLSASMALGMALNGAGGETFDAMRGTLRYGTASLADIDAGYRDLIALLTTLDRTSTILVANSVWSNQGFPINPAFVTAAKTFFDAEARTVDFRGAGTVALINDWVKTKTNGRIPVLLDQIDPDEVAFLINAIYFKGQWRSQFDKSQTRDRPFHVASGEVRDVPTMSLDASILLGGGDGYHAAELLYGNGTFAMTIVLPWEGHGVREVLEGFDPATWRDMVNGLREGHVPLQLPKFKFSTQRTLTQDLADLGMGIAFDPSRADFSGIADVAPDRLYISRVLQKAVVEVNEEGTEAAAATAVGIGVTSVPQPMIVDRPFLFVIRERLTGTILFIGQVNDLPA